METSLRPSAALHIARILRASQLILKIMLTTAVLPLCLSLAVVLVLPVVETLVIKQLEDVETLVMKQPGKSFLYSMLLLLISKSVSLALGEWHSTSHNASSVAMTFQVMA